MKKISQVIGHIRHNKNGSYSFVRQHPRKFEVAIQRKNEALFKLFGPSGYDLLHSVGGEDSPSPDKYGEAVLLGLSTDDGYQGMLEKVKTIKMARDAVKAADAFIGRHGDTPCKGLYSGCPMSQEDFKKALKSGKVDLSWGLPIYATPLRGKAKSFSSYMAKPNDVHCVFEVVDGRVRGNAGHHSKHEDEQEVCFKSTTKVTIAGKPVVIGEGSEDKYYHVKVRFE